MHLIWLLCLALGTAACLPSSPPSTAPPPAPTPTPITVYEARTASVAARHTPQPVPSRPAGETTPAAGGAPCPAPTSDTPASQVEVIARLNYAEARVTVDQTTTYRNDTGTTLSEIVLYVAPNAQPGEFTLEALSLPEELDAAPARLEGVRLTVPLGHSLEPNCTQHIELRYVLTPFPIGGGYFPQQGYLGHADHQFNLGHWIPTVAAYDQGEWLTPTRINVGEQAVIPAADFDVSLTIRNAPAGLVVVGPGTVEHQGITWHFVLPAARDLTITLSDQYQRLTETAANGVEVEVYTLDDALPPEDADYDAPAQALETAVAAIALYSDLYGAYPYDRFVVVESVFPDGMEFSGLVFVGGEWFRSYAGNPASYLTLITAHETSHQWWYALVANDQSRDPWLDEALATYSEYVFLQENYPALTEWWWNFRINTYSPTGAVDSTVYEFDTVRGYINAVYLRGARMMHALRHDLGGEAYFQWLHDYVAANRGQIAFPADLWAALPPDALATVRNTASEYLTQPDSRP